MEEKFIPYDQMRSSYRDTGIQPASAPNPHTIDTAPEPREVEQQVEQIADSVGIPLQETTPVDTEDIPGSESIQTTGKEEETPSLLQLLSSILRNQRVLEEKLCSMIEWQERQERDAQGLRTQMEMLTSRVESIESSLSSISASRQPLQGTAVALEDIQKALARAEKSNLDAIRESKNFQQTLYAKQNKELDGYRSLHSHTANASILTEIAHFRNAAEDVAGRLDDKQAKNLRIGVVEAIDELLEDNGVEIHRTPVGQHRSLKTCQTRKQVPTGDQALHGMVAYSVTPSFAIGNLVLLKEIVDTYVYDASLNIQPADSEQELIPDKKQEELPPEGSETTDTNPNEDKDVPEGVCVGLPFDQTTSSASCQSQEEAPLSPTVSDENFSSDTL